MTIHIQTWSGSATARVTDMTNAGKRGKKCRVLRVSGVCWDAWAAKGDAVKEAAVQFTRLLMANFGETRLHPLGEFDVCRDAVLKVVAEARAAGVPEGYLAAHDEEIRGVDAPRPKLTAGVEGKWWADADEGGIGLYDQADVNEWAEVTHQQTGAAAYAIAVKVWPQVQAAKTLHEAATILRAAGARLHGYCRMD